MIFGKRIQLSQSKNKLPSASEACFCRSALYTRKSWTCNGTFTLGRAFTIRLFCTPLFPPFNVMLVTLYRSTQSLDSSTLLQSPASSVQRWGSSLWDAWYPSQSFIFHQQLTYFFPLIYHVISRYFYSQSYQPLENRLEFHFPRKFLRKLRRPCFTDGGFVRELSGLWDIVDYSDLCHCWKFCKAIACSCQSIWEMLALLVRLQVALFC